MGALGPELLLCLEAVRALAGERVQDAAEFLYVHLVNVAAADTLREGLAADADILTGEHVAALLKACGDQLARDTPRVLPVLRLWRTSLGAMQPAPDLEAEQRQALASLEPRLLALESADWRQISMCLGLHLEEVPDSIRRDMRSCSSLEGLWGLLVDAIASVDSIAALQSLVAAIGLHVGLPQERPAWVLALKKRPLGGPAPPAGDARPPPAARSVSEPVLPAAAARRQVAQPPPDWQPPVDVSVRMFGHRGLDHGVVCRALRDRLGTDLGLAADSMVQGSVLLGQLS